LEKKKKKWKRRKARGVLRSTQPSMPLSLSLSC